MRYRRREAVRSFTFGVRAGGWLGLIGPNGAGKSSILRACAGIVPFTGEVVIDGTSLQLAIAASAVRRSWRTCPSRRCCRTT